MAKKTPRKVTLGGSSTRKPKVNLSNTYGIKPASTKKAGPTGAVTQGSTKNKHTKQSFLGKVRG